MSRTNVASRLRHRLLAHHAERLHKSCTVLRTEPKARTAEMVTPPTDREISSKPWEILAGDLFHLKGKYYLLIVDMFSKYHIVHSLPSIISFEAIIDKLKDTF